MAEIKLSDLSYRYPGADEDTLQQLQLSIGDGEAHALLGGSGAGKTTLLNLLSGLLQPTAGEICFGGEPVGTIPAAERGVAQVFQFPVLYDALSVLDNLSFPLRTQRVGAAKRRQRALQVAAMLELEDNGFTDLKRTKAGSLSLYQKQLLAIGKALVRPDVELVLLDEPLTAVQPSLKWALRRTLKQIQRELGVTMVYVTHDQTEALTFADRVSVMRDGGILQCDTPERLYLQPEHTYIGYFIGSPGMNFIPAKVRAGVMERGHERWPLQQPVADGPVQIGFRPEWAQLALPGQRMPATALRLDAKLVQARMTGLADGTRIGLMQLNLPEPVQVSGTLQFETGSRVELLVTQYVLFRNDRQIATVTAL